MQTIRVEVTQRSAENATVYSIDQKVIATISPDIFNPGRYVYNIRPLQGNTGVTLQTALRAVKSKIVAHFRAWNLNVEFVNA